MPLTDPTSKNDVISFIRTASEIQDACDCALSHIHHVRRVLEQDNMSAEFYMEIIFPMIEEIRKNNAIEISKLTKLHNSYMASVGPSNDSNKPLRKRWKNIFKEIENISNHHLTDKVEN